MTCYAPHSDHIGTPHSGIRAGKQQHSVLSVSLILETLDKLLHTFISFYFINFSLTLILYLSSQHSQPTFNYLYSKVAWKKSLINKIIRPPLVLPLVLISILFNCILFCGIVYLNLYVKCMLNIKVTLFLLNVPISKYTRYLTTKRRF